MEKRSSRDFLSDLPLSIIHCILERVPIRDAVKTSILSRQWRYKWATLPHLVFDHESVSSSGVVSSSGDYAVRLKNCITETLILHQGPIHKFKLYTSVLMANCLNVHQWLLFLSRNDLRILILSFYANDDWFRVHSSLYSCQNLSHLELVQCEISPPPPTFKGFLCLRCLVLQDIYSSDTIESLVANSPLLEKLTLQFSKILELKIRAPNLKTLYLREVYNDICLYAPLLVKMQVLGFRNLPKGGLQQKTSACNYTNFLGGLTSLEELIGDHYFIKFLSIGVESCQSSLVFHHLRDIKLFKVDLHDMKVTSVVVRLITDAPNLHKLEISSLVNQPPAPEVPAVSFWDSECAPNFTFVQSFFNQPSASESFWDSECAPNFTFERLKVIEMKNVRGGLDEMKFIKFLLASSPVLEKMIYKPDSDLDAEKLLILAAELLSYRRASSNAQILFRKS